MEAGRSERSERSELEVDGRRESFAPVGAIWEEDVIVRWGLGTTGCATLKAASLHRVATCRRPAGTRRRGRGRVSVSAEAWRARGAQAPSCGWGVWGECLCFTGPGASASGSNKAVGWEGARAFTDPGLPAWGSYGGAKRGLPSRQVGAGQGWGAGLGGAGKGVGGGRGARTGRVWGREGWHAGCLFADTEVSLCD
jgi:hypothetical protein